MAACFRAAWLDRLLQRLAAVRLMEYTGCFAMPFSNHRCPIAALSPVVVPAVSASLLLAAAPQANANCGPSGCASGPAPAYVQPAFTPTLGQEMLLEARKAAAEAWQPELVSPRAPVMVGLSAPDGGTGMASPASSNAVRSWSNGEGQWMSSPSGAACQVSSRGSLGSSTPCTDGF